MNPIAKKVLAGDVQATARLLRDVDDRRSGVMEILKDLYPHTGRAYTIGVTGAPGTGKSTLVDRMVSSLRQQDRTVGVLAVDPTSPLSGGAILGDRIRMNRHCLDQGVFIMSLATRGIFGGLTRSTLSAIDILDAMGKDCVIVETVGVGQGEVNVAMSVHTTVIVVNPGMGDGVQALKAGLLEVGDIYVVNKADREGVEATVNDLSLMIDMDYNQHEKPGWKPPIVKTQALMDQGIKLVSNGTDNHLMLIDLTDNGITGKELEATLGLANITVNKNAIPNDPRSPFITSGIRLGTPAATSRGFDEEAFRQVDPIDPKKSPWAVQVGVGVQPHQTSNLPLGEVRLGEGLEGMAQLQTRNLLLGDLPYGAVPLQMMKLRNHQTQMVH